MARKLTPREQAWLDLQERYRLAELDELRAWKGQASQIALAEIEQQKKVVRWEKRAARKMAKRTPEREAPAPEIVDLQRVRKVRLE